MENIKQEILDRLDKLTLVIDSLERENTELKRERARVIPLIPPVTMDKIDKLSVQTGVSSGAWVDEYLKLGLTLASGKFKSLPVASEIHRAFERLAKGRLQTVADITTDEEFTEWVLAGLENEKF